MNDDTIETRLEEIESRLDFLESNSSPFIEQKKQDKIIALINEKIQNSIDEYILDNKVSPIYISFPEKRLTNRNDNICMVKSIINSDIRYIDKRLKDILFTKEDIIDFFNRNDIAIKTKRIYDFFLAKNKCIQLKIEEADKKYLDNRRLFQLEFECKDIAIN